MYFRHPRCQSRKSSEGSSLTNRPGRLKAEANKRAAASKKRASDSAKTPLSDTDKQRGSPGVIMLSMSHLDNAKSALERQARYGKRGGPTPEDMLDAIKEIIAHLEDIGRPPVITVNKPTK